MQRPKKFIKGKSPPPPLVTVLMVRPLIWIHKIGYYSHCFYTHYSQ